MDKHSFMKGRKGGLVAQSESSHLMISLPFPVAHQADILLIKKFSVLTLKRGRPMFN